MRNSRAGLAREYSMARRMNLNQDTFVRSRAVLVCDNRRFNCRGPAILTRQRIIKDAAGEQCFGTAKSPCSFCRCADCETHIAHNVLPRESTRAARATLPPIVATVLTRTFERVSSVSAITGANFRGASQIGKPCHRVISALPGTAISFCLCQL
jgi:hypothetical protein